MRITLLHLFYILLAVGALVGTTSCGSTIYGAGLDMQRVRDKAGKISQPRQKTPTYRQPSYQGGYQGQQPSYQGGYQGQQPSNQGGYQGQARTFAPTGSQQNGRWN